MDIDESQGESSQEPNSPMKRSVPHANSDALQLPWVEKYRPKRWVPPLNIYVNVFPHHLSPFSCSTLPSPFVTCIQSGRFSRSWGYCPNISVSRRFGQLTPFTSLRTSRNRQDEYHCRHGQAYVWLQGVCKYGIGAECQWCAWDWCTYTEYRLTWVQL